MLQRIETLVRSPRGPLWIGLFAFVLCLPALRLGLQADDHILGWQVEHDEPAWSMFHARDSMIRQGRENGAMAWWASPRLSVCFFRPLASITHYVEFTLWPNAPWLMLLFNALIYGVAAWLGARAYREFGLDERVSSIAAVMFAIDDAHAQSAGWISGRNTVLALLGSLAALLLHQRARATDRFSLTLASALAVAAALLSAEAGTWSMAYLLAYALTQENGTLWSRLRTLAPQLVVGLLWFVVYVVGDFGLRGSSWYRDPHAPLSALVQGLLDIPLSFASLFGPSLIALSVLQPANVARVAVVPVAALLLWLLLPLSLHDKRTRFFALATGLCLLPTFLTVPQDRVLMGASFGAFGLIAQVIVRGRDSTHLRERVSRRVMLTIHVGLALLLFPIMLGAQHGFELGAQALIAVVQPKRDVILINTPVELLSNYVGGALDRDAHRSKLPNTLHQLYSGGSELWFTRVDDYTLDVTATRGWGFTAVERIFCQRSDMPVVGSTVHARNMTARVTASTDDGMPETVRFTFPTRLESPERQWLVWQGTEPVAWTPPAVGQRTRLAPLNMLAALPP